MTVNNNLLIYGANGYTGKLVAQEAVKQGLKPTLAGRNKDAITKLANSLGVRAAIFSLNDKATLENSLQNVDVVINCAGPFAETSKQMISACLKTKAHYLDITGELGVFKYVEENDKRAKAVGIMLMPGVGFDVVPTDCLAVYLKEKLPTSTHLALAFQVIGSNISHGTAKTILTQFEVGSVSRRHGKLVKTAFGVKQRNIEVVIGQPHSMMSIPLGDNITAFKSTGIPNISCYGSAPSTNKYALKLMVPALKLITLSPIKSVLCWGIDRFVTGPTVEQQNTGKTFVWGEAVDKHSGKTVVARLQTCEPYRFTALAAIRAAQLVLNGVAPSGFQTPGMAFGSNFVSQIEDCSEIT